MNGYTEPDWKIAERKAKILAGTWNQHKTTGEAKASPTGAKNAKG